MGMRGPGARTSESARLGGRAANDEAVSTVRKAVRQGLLVDAGLGSCGNRRGAGASPTPPRLSLSEAAAGRGAGEPLPLPRRHRLQSRFSILPYPRGPRRGRCARSGKFSKTPERPGRLARPRRGAKYPSRRASEVGKRQAERPCFSRRAPRITNSCMSPAPEANTATLPFRPLIGGRAIAAIAKTRNAAFRRIPPPDGGARIDP